MQDPVIASNGYSYEKEAMENWISKNKWTSLMTNLTLPSMVLTPNRTLKMAINRWLETLQKIKFVLFCIIYILSLISFE